MNEQRDEARAEHHSTNGAIALQAKTKNIRTYYNNINNNSIK